MEAGRPARPDTRGAAPRGAQALRRWRRRVTRIRERKRRVEEAEQRRVRRLERQIGVEPSAQQVQSQPLCFVKYKGYFSVVSSCQDSAGLERAGQHINGYMLVCTCAGMSQ
jgi:hypothetical protein